MSRISGLHIGIEHLSEVDSAHDLAGLPERYVLPPDGHSVEAHFDGWIWHAPPGIFTNCCAPRRFARPSPNYARPWKRRRTPTCTRRHS